MANGMGKTHAMSTEWVVEVFDWDDEVPDSTDGIPGIDDVFPGAKNSIMSASVGVLGQPSGGVSDQAYMNNDILTSMTTESGLSALGIKSKLPIKIPGSSEDGDVNSLKWASEHYKSNMSSGVISISFRRDKQNANQQCTIGIVGPLPHRTRIGSWVIVSLIKAGSGIADATPKFIGQIFNVSTEYSTLQSGAVVSRSSVNVSSWSNLLLSRLAFDMRSGAAMVDGSPAVQMMSSMVDAGVMNQSLGLDFYTDASKLQLNPYQSAKYFLSLIGLIGQSGFNKPEQKLFRSSACMPQMPKKFAERLGWNNDNKEAFSLGFVKVIAGRLNDKSLDLGSGWDGFFDDKNTFDSYVKKFDDYEGKNNLQPYLPNMATVAQVRQASVWELVTSYCDPQLNEVFTDIFYEKTSNGCIKSYLALVVRGRPYKTKAAENQVFGADVKTTKVAEKPASGNDIVTSQSPSSIDPVGMGKDFIKGAASDAVSGAISGALSGVSGSDQEQNAIYKTWDSFENIPRINLDSTLILGITINNTFTTSPNLFQLGYYGVSPELISKFYTNYLSYYLKRHDAEMLRFGSIQSTMFSQYCFLENEMGTDSFSWFTAMAGLQRVWDGCNYRTASGSIKIKDPGIPLTIGFNIRFEISGIIYVAQIESVETNFSIDPRGVKTTNTMIQYSRLMQEKENGSSELVFCPASRFGDLWNDSKFKANRKK